jgi:hypothetical protein
MADERIKMKKFDLLQNLSDIANELDQQGAFKSASVITDVMKRVSQELSEEQSGSKILSVGDEVMWRGGFGQHAPLPARVTGIFIPNQQGDADGEGKNVEVIPWSAVDSVIIDVSSEGKTWWAYGDQISRVTDEDRAGHDWYFNPEPEQDENEENY